MSQVIAGSIEEQEKILREKEQKKKELLHDTCEEFAGKRTNDMVVKLAFFKNKEGAPYFSSEEFDNLSRKKLMELVVLYNTSTEPLKIENVQDIAAHDFFTTYYTLVESQPSTFFKKPVHELTFFQVNLLTYARIINSIYKNFDPPDRIKGDAKAIIAFANTEAKKRKKKERHAAKGNNPSVVGGRG